MSTPKSLEVFNVIVQKPTLHLERDLTDSRKLPLNRAMQRNLARNISKVYHTISQMEESEAIQCHNICGLDIHFNMISTMMFFMQFGGCFVTLFNMYIIKILFWWNSMRRVLLYWIIDDVTINKAFG